MSKKNYTNYSKPEAMNIPEFDESLNEVIEEDVVANETVEEIVEDSVEETVEEKIVEKEPVVEEVESETSDDSTTLGVVENCASLRVRHAPNSDGEILATISSGTEVEIDLDNSTSDFYKVCTAAGLDGYCMKKFITLR